MNHLASFIFTKRRHFRSHPTVVSVYPCLLITSPAESTVRAANQWTLHVLSTLLELQNMPKSLALKNTGSKNSSIY